MQLARLIYSALIGISVLGMQQQTAPVTRPDYASPPVVDDRYSVSTVRSALQFIQRGGNTIEAKGYIWPLMSLGDRVSVAVLKIYTRDELVIPQNTRAYVIVVRNAFSSRSNVLEKSDVDPKITLFVLQYLKEIYVSDPEVEKDINYLQGCVKDFTCGPRSAF
jgi:hypothetical protein